MTLHLESDTPQVIQTALHIIADIKHCMNSKAHLIEDIESILKKFSDYFNTEQLKLEFEDVCASWFELLRDLEEVETKLNMNLSSKTFFQTQLTTLKETLQRHQDTLTTIEDVTTEIKLRSAIEILENLQIHDKTVEEAINKIVLEGKNIIRSIDNVTEMKKIQCEIQSLQSSYRVIQNSISMKHKKYTTILLQLDEYKSLIQSHELYIDATQNLMENLSDVLDENIIEYNKDQLRSFENSILDKRLEHDKVITLAETGTGCYIIYLVSPLFKIYHSK